MSCDVLRSEANSPGSICMARSAASLSIMCSTTSLVFKFSLRAQTPASVSSGANPQLLQPPIRRRLRAQRAMSRRNQRAFQRSGQRQGAPTLRQSELNRSAQRLELSFRKISARMAMPRRRQRTKRHREQYRRSVREYSRSKRPLKTVCRRLR